MFVGAFISVGDFFSTSCNSMWCRHYVCVPCTTVIWWSSTNCAVPGAEFSQNHALLFSLISLTDDIIVLHENSLLFNITLFFFIVQFSFHHIIIIIILYVILLLRAGYDDMLCNLILFMYSICFNICHELVTLRVQKFLFNFVIWTIIFNI